MNFDRKSGNSNGKTAEGAQTFPDITPIFEDRAQEDFTIRNAPAAYQNNREDYPSGAFPALDIAYPDQTMRDAGGNSVSHSTQPYRFAGNAGYEADGRAYGQAYAPAEAYKYDAADGSEGGYAADGRQAAYPAQQGAYPQGGVYRQDADAPRRRGQSYNEENLRGHSGQGMAENPFTEQRPEAAEPYREQTYQPRGRQNAHGGSPRAAGYPQAQGGAEADDDEGYLQAAAPSAASQARFAEETFHGDLGQDSALQPVRFDPSDYDYNYDAALLPAYPDPQLPAYSDAEQNFAAGYPQSHAAAKQDYGFFDAEAEQTENLPRSQAAYDQDFEQPDFSGDYSVQGGAYSEAQPLPYDEGDFAPQSGRNRERASFQGSPAPRRDLAEADFGCQTGAAEPALSAALPYEAEETAMPPFDAPAFAAYEQEAGTLSADFIRLHDDAEDIDRAAGRLPHTAPQPQSGGRQNGQSQANQAADWDNFGLESASAGQAGGGAFPGIGPEEDFAGLAHNAAAARQPHQSGFAAEQGFSPDNAYDDMVYDWAAPAAAVAQPYVQRRAPQSSGRFGEKSKKILLSAAVLLALALVGAGLYWIFGASHGFQRGEPIIIHKAEGDYKVKPNAPMKNAAEDQEQSVSEGVSGGSAVQSAQKALIDKTETPVEMQKMEERLPFSDEKDRSFDQSSVDSLIKTIAAQATPVHIVPSVRVDTDRKIIAAARGSAEKILIPGGGIFLSKGIRQTQERNKKDDDKSASAAPPAQIAAAKPALPPAKAAQAVAPVRPLKPAAQKAPTAAAAGNFFMQISSQPTKEAAELSLRKARNYLSAEQAAKLVIVPAAIPDKGTYYRVRIPAESRDAAAALCETYKQSGGNCFVAR